MYTIDDIGIDDAWYPQRDSLIGTIVTLDEITKCHSDGYVQAHLSVSGDELERMGFEYNHMFFRQVLLKPVQ